MERKSSKKIQRLQSNIPLLLREGQGFFGCWDPSLGEPLEPLEGVVDEDPVLVRLPGVIVGWSSYLKSDVREVVEVAGVVNGADLDGDGGGTLLLHHVSLPEYLHGV